MVSRKRGLQEFESNEFSSATDILSQVRNMWEFANLSQWIYLFGRAVKISDEVDIEHIESECLKPDSTVLSEIGLALLKFVSSHRGLTHEVFDEYTRRQYVAKAPHHNPFGTDIEPIHFKDFDVFTKIRVLQQLTQWTMVNPERIRERTIEQKDIEQVKWRVEQFGQDSEDRIYVVLADNRLYRRIVPKSQPVKPKKIFKKTKNARRISERIRASGLMESSSRSSQKEPSGNTENIQNENENYFEIRWECMAISLEDYESFLSPIKKSRNPNEKMLVKRITNEILPLLEKQMEIQQRKRAQKERELLNLQRLACAKRSSRIASKMEQQRQSEELRSIEHKRAAEIAMAQKEKQKWISMEKERDSRIMTREQRLREREARRILHEEELADLTGDKNRVENGEARLSERHLKAEIERKKQILEKLAEDDDWVFDCICGAYGQIDDGSHSIACDKCSTWQHSKCVGVDKTEADRNDFSFVCATCKRRADDQERAKTKLPITIKLSRQCLKSTSDKLQSKSYPVKISSSSKSTDYEAPVQNLNLKDPVIDRNEANRASPQSIKLSYSQKNAPTSIIIDNPDNVGDSSPSRIPVPTNNEVCENSSKDSKSIMSPFFDYQQENYDNPLSEGFSQKQNTSTKPPHIQSCTDDTILSRATNMQDKKLDTELQATESDLIQSLRSQSPVEVDQIPHEKISTDYQSSSYNYNRRSSSSNFTTLLISAPTLSPCPFTNAGQNNVTPINSRLVHFPDSQHIDSLRENKENALSNEVSSSESYNSAALPPAVTGVSPTKNCQPIHMINGNHGTKPLSTLSPFASLVPCPQIPNNSSPVKPSESEKYDKIDQLKEK